MTVGSFGNPLTEILTSDKKMCLCHLITASFPTDRPLRDLYKNQQNIPVLLTLNMATAVNYKTILWILPFVLVLFKIVIRLEVGSALVISCKKEKGS